MDWFLYNFRLTFCRDAVPTRSSRLKESVDSEEKNSGALASKLSTAMAVSLTCGAGSEVNGDLWTRGTLLDG